MYHRMSGGCRRCGIRISVAAGAGIFRGAGGGTGGLCRHRRSIAVVRSGKLRGIGSRRRYRGDRRAPAGEGIVFGGIVRLGGRAAAVHGRGAVIPVGGLQRGAAVFESDGIFVDLPDGVQLRVRVGGIGAACRIRGGGGGTAGAPAEELIVCAGGRGGTECQIFVAIFGLRGGRAGAAVGVVFHLVDRLKTEGIRTGGQVAVFFLIVIRFYADQIFRPGGKLFGNIEVSVGAAHEIVVAVAAVVIRPKICTRRVVGAVVIDQNVGIQRRGGGGTVKEIGARFRRCEGIVIDGRWRGNGSGVGAVYRQCGGVVGIPQRIVGLVCIGYRDAFRRHSILVLRAGAGIGPSHQRMVAAGHGNLGQAQRRAAGNVGFDVAAVAAR